MQSVVARSYLMATVIAVLVSCSARSDTNWKGVWEASAAPGYDAMTHQIGTFTTFADCQSAMVAEAGRFNRDAVPMPKENQIVRFRAYKCVQNETAITVVQDDEILDTE